MPQPAPRLLDVMRDRIRLHSGRHPQKLDGPDVQAFPNHLTVDRKVSASTQNQALSAILFLYSKMPHPWVANPLHRQRHWPRSAACFNASRYQSLPSGRRDGEKT